MLCHLVSNKYSIREILTLFPKIFSPFFRLRGKERKILDKNGEVAPGTKLMKLEVKDSMAELYLLFFESSIITFTNFNKFLQREEPLISSVYYHMQTFMNKLASKFIKPNAKKSFTKLDESLECQKVDNNFISFISKQTLKKLLED